MLGAYVSIGLTCCALGGLGCFYMLAWGHTGHGGVVLGNCLIDANILDFSKASLLFYLYGGQRTVSETLML